MARGGRYPLERAERIAGSTEADPLLYPQCGVEMKPVAVIQDVGVVTDGWGEWWGLIHLFGRAL